ncbi:MAG: outer membrane protein assembly factor BamC [Gammaproteobacteria bacterium]|nr:outer membrane protein assembly factor BamC [Gammaproteobacteria bacterium]
MFKTCMGSLLLVALLSGCSKIMPKLDEVIPDNRVEYKKSKTMPDLEVPPDLTTEAIKDKMAIPEGGDKATYSTYQERIADRKRKEQIEKSQNEAVKVLENEHVIAVDGLPVQIWPKLRSFMAESNYKLELDDADLGVIETVWQENQEKLTRDKFKIFAEAGAKAGTTVLYVSQRGEELVTKAGDQVWQSRPRNVELEGEFVAKLQSYLSGTPVEAAAGAPAAAAAAGETAAAAAPDADTGLAAGGAQLVKSGGGKMYIALAQDFSAAWRSTAVALQRAGIDIVSSDKSRSVYMVKVPAKEGMKPKKSLMSKMKFWGDDEDVFELQVDVSGVGEKTEVTVLDKDGRWETGPIAEDVLGRLLNAYNAAAL